LTYKEDYWNTVLKNFKNTFPETQLRIYSDLVNASLLERWLPVFPVDYLLKTDLFDEAVSEGLYPLLESKAKRVVVMDMSFFSHKAASSRYNNLKGTVADVRCLPFKDSTFDLIVSNSTLDHFESRDEIITSLYEIHRVLLPSGQLILTMDNLANPIIALRNALPFDLLNRLGLVPYYVGATFGPGRTRRILEHIGFEVKDVTAIMHCPRILAVAIARILNYYKKNDMQRRFLSFLMSFESLSRLPTRYLTGYFVAVSAIKR
jgi:SAM-dependent methyltransferase